MPSDHCLSNPSLRQGISFASGNDTCHAWVYLPEGASSEQRVPVVVMAHGLGAVKQGRLAAFAERFQAAGYACLVFDYRYFGESSGEPRERLDIRSQREDWRAAVAHARTLPQVDPARVVVWGTSFGGGHAIVTAADDPTLAAVIAQCPFTDGVSSSLAITPLNSLKVGWWATLDLMASLLGRDPVRVATAAPPGVASLMTASDAWEGVCAIHRASDLPETPVMVPARIAFQIMFDAPGRRAKDVSCPALYVVCKQDSVAPAQATLRHVRQSPRGTVIVYEEGHFGIYLGEAFERNVADQLAFLQSHVPVPCR